MYEWIYGIAGSPMPVEARDKETRDKWWYCNYSLRQLQLGVMHKLRRGPRKLACRFDDCTSSQEIVDRLILLREGVLEGLAVERIRLTAMWPNGAPRFDGPLCGTWENGRHFVRRETCCRCGREIYFAANDYLSFLCMFGRLLYRPLTQTTDDACSTSMRAEVVLERLGRRFCAVTSTSLPFMGSSVDAYEKMLEYFVALELPPEACLFNAKIEDMQARRMLMSLFLKGAFDSSQKPTLCKDCCAYFIRQGVEGEWCHEEHPDESVGLGKRKEILVDGSNVIRANNSCGVLGFQSVLRALREKGWRCHVLFDANIEYVVERDYGRVQKEKLVSLLTGSDCAISCVPGGSRADEYILCRANTDGLLILSNDQYRDYQVQYPWIVGERRVHKFVFSNGRLLIPDFGIDVKIVCDERDEKLGCENQ